MKISEVTAAEVAEHLRLDYADMTALEIEQLQVVVDSAKAFIKSYAGLEDKAVEAETVAYGDGETIKFSVAYTEIVAESYTVYIDDVEQTETADYTINKSTGEITFVTAPASGVVITADYSAIPSDEFADLVIALYVLCQDMYDNRSMYVEKSNVNRVVETILGMHSTNLL